MKRNVQLTFLFGLCLVLLLALPAVGGPLFPCVKAVGSKNGNFLVLTDVQPEPGQGNAQRVLLHVFPKETFINTKDRLAAPASYWTDWIRWSVILDANRIQNEPQPCPLPLITDDGEFLVLLHVGPTLSGERAVLQIYRRRDHPGDPVRKGPDHGVFIKSIVLKEIWPSDKIAENTAARNDEFPPLGVPGSSVVAQVHECRYMTACEPLRNSREIASWVIHHSFNWNRCRHVANISVNRRPS